MTKRWLLIPALVAVAVTVYSTASTAAAPPWAVERYYTTETWHAFADVGKKDNGGPDDVYVAQQTLETPAGTSVGVVNGYGVNLHAPYVFFHWTAALSGGTLTIEGAVNLRKKTTVYAIAGGTGRFAAAQGTVTLTDAGSKGALATIRYTRRPGAA
jgi:Dirigent-like protein